MYYLIFSILSSTLILITFKISERWKIEILPIILINYIAAALLGAVLNRTYEISLQELKILLLPAMVLGALFIGMFYLIGTSTRKVGIAITTVSSKMSVIIPIIFSILYYSEDKNLLKISGIVLAIIAVLLTVIKKRKQNNADKAIFILPAAIFFGMGITDSLLKYSQEAFLTPENSAVFSGMSFAFAGLFGLGLAAFRQKGLLKTFQPKNILVGSLLGSFNFGSMYFLILAFDSKILDSSILFGINNVGVVVLSVPIGVLGFSEKLSLINKIGVICCIIAIYMLIQ